MTTPRPFHEWHEDLGPMLWWLWPISDAPYVGTPLDLGRTVSFDVSVQIGVDLYEVEPKKVGMTGGWPWADSDDDTEARLFWTELPCAGALDTAIRDHIRGGPENEVPGQAAPASEDGYQLAFYELAKIMGIEARAAAPGHVWRSEMLPRILRAFA